jgi:hypothetical protein
MSVANLLLLAGGSSGSRGIIALTLRLLGFDVRAAAGVGVLAVVEGPHPSLGSCQLGAAGRLDPLLLDHLHCASHLPRSSMRAR